MRGYGLGPEAKQQQYQGLGSNASDYTTSAGKFYTGEPSGSGGSGLPFVQFVSQRLTHAESLFS